MSIERRFHYKGDYTRIPNITADDRNLEADTLGVLAYLLAKADTWKPNVKNIRDRFKMGRNRAYAILAELEEAGYLQRNQGRTAEQQFSTGECIVFDVSETAQAATGKVVNIDGTPLPQNRDTAHPAPDTAPAEGAVSPKAVSPKRGHIIKTKGNNTPSEELDAPQGALEEKDGNPSSPSQAPSLNAQVWNAAKAILQPKEFGCVSSWLQRVKDRPKGIETLLGIIEAAHKAGTPQAVAYITGALNRVFPPPPDPREFTRAYWERAAQAVTKTRHWPVDWGPRPGEHGCLMPIDLISPELMRAVALRRVA